MQWGYMSAQFGNNGIFDQSFPLDKQSFIKDFIRHLDLITGILRDKIFCNIGNFRTPPFYIDNDTADYPRKECTESGDGWIEAEGFTPAQKAAHYFLHQIITLIRSQAFQASKFPDRVCVGDKKLFP